MVSAGNFLHLPLLTKISFIIKQSDYKTHERHELNPLGIGPWGPSLLNMLFRYQVNNRWCS